MTPLSQLLEKWLLRRPLIVALFDQGFSESIRESRRGFLQFTAARSHDELDGLKLPSICLAEVTTDAGIHCFLGIVQSKMAVTTFESRVSFQSLKPFWQISLSEILLRLPDRRFATLLEGKLNQSNFLTQLSPKLSTEIGKLLAEHNAAKLDQIAQQLPRFRPVSTPEWEQRDAVKTALAAFGMTESEAQEYEIATAQTPNRKLEDYVIWKDASGIPGFDLVRRFESGHRVFVKGEERLDIFLANKGPLELMMGVDLIYINATQGNTVMVQYKMLERDKDDEDKTTWIFRPDGQFEKERLRMTIPPVNEAREDYRLNRIPFYFKFVKRHSAVDHTQSYVISNEHLELLLSSPAAIGPRGGIRITYEALGGSYLRESDFISLIRSGYIGTHRIETTALQPIIEAVANGDRALVLAWEQLGHRRPST